MSWRVIGRAAVALTVGAVTLTGVAAAQRDETAGAGNHALVDADATAEVVARASEATSALFTYDYRDPEGHRKVFDERTTADFADRYEELFGTTLAQAAEQQYTLSSTVAEAGVRLLTDDRAEVLVFIDQTGKRGDTNQETGSKSMFLATLRPEDGEWKIADLDLFEGR
jgi:Mce-associated membrane protein